MRPLTLVSEGASLTTARSHAPSPALQRAEAG
nr:MAG TPA: hypothetical protein [Caudoviricetes sp.]